MAGGDESDESEGEDGGIDLNRTIAEESLRGSLEEKKKLPHQILEKKTLRDGAETSHSQDTWGRYLSRQKIQKDSEIQKRR